MTPLFLLFFLLVFLLQALILIVLVGLRTRLKGIQEEQHHFSLRIDFLRREIEKIGSQTGALPERRDFRPPGILAPPPVVAPPEFGGALPRRSVPPAPGLPPMMMEAPDTSFSGWREIVDFMRGAFETLMSWVLVKDRFPDEEVSRVRVVVGAWLLRLSVILTGIGFLHGLIFFEQAWRLVLTGIAAMVMIGFAIVLQRRALWNFSALLAVGGCYVLNAVLIAAAVIGYRSWLWILLLIVIALETGFSAWARRSLFAWPALLAAYILPFVSDFMVTHAGWLYGYLALVSGVFLLLAHLYAWRSFHGISLLGAYGTFLWFGARLEGAAYSGTSMFLVIVFLLHSLATFLRNVWGREKTDLYDILCAISNALVFYAAIHMTGWWSGDRSCSIAVAVGLSVLYIGLTFLYVRKCEIDRGILLSLMGLAGLFAVIVLFLTLRDQALTVGLGLLAFMLIWLGQRVVSNFIQTMGYLIYAFVFVFLLWDIGRCFGAGELLVADFSWPVYGRYFLSRAVSFSLAIMSIYGAYLIQDKEWAVDYYDSISPEKDTDSVMDRNLAARIFYWAGILFTFLVVYFEFSILPAFPAIHREAVLTAFCSAMGGFFLWQYRHSPNRDAVMLYALCVFSSGAALKLLVLDLRAWGLSWSLVYPLDWMNALVRTACFGIVAGVLGEARYVLRRHPLYRGMGALLGGLALLVVCVGVCLEIHTAFAMVYPAFQTMALTLTGLSFAIGFLVRGVVRDRLMMRFAGLFLLAVFAVKTLFWDWRTMSPNMQMATILVFGLVFVIGAALCFNPRSQHNAP